MAQRSLSERVEVIGLSKSALPSALTLERLENIFTNLEKMGKTEVKRNERSVFGANSICNCMNSFLVSQGCPSPSRVERSFVAAAEHSELGKMMQWFASAVVALFVDGVKSGVMFPQEWDEFMRRNPTLTNYTFELQGFSALFSFLLCRLAAVECVLSERGVSGELDAARKKPFLGRMWRRRVEESYEGDEGQPECTQEMVFEGSLNTPVSHDEEVVVTPQKKIVKNTEDASKKKFMPSTLLQRSLTAKVNRRYMQTTCNSGEMPIQSHAKEEPLSLPAIVPVQGSLSLRPKIKQDIMLRFSSLKQHQNQHRNTYGKGPTLEITGIDPLYSQNRHVDKNITPLCLHICSMGAPSKKVRDKTECVYVEDIELGGSAPPNVEYNQPKTVEISEDPVLRRRERMSQFRPNPLKMEKIEQQLRSRELCKMYNVKKIVNYTERDLKEYVEDIHRLREILDVEENKEVDEKEEGTDVELK